MRAVRRWLGYFALLLWFLIEVRGAFIQFQISWFGGQVVLSPAVFKIGLAVVLILAALVVRSLGPPRLMLLWLVFVTYLVVDGLYLTERFSYSLSYVVSGYVVYFLFLIIIPLAFALFGSVSQKTVIFWLMLLFIPLALLGLVQGASNNPVVATEAANGSYAVNSWYAGGVATRAFSLFDSAEDFGHYIALVGAAAVALSFNRNWKIKFVGLVFIGLVAAVGYATLTRATYMEIAMAMGAAYLLIRAKRMLANRLLFLIPIAYGAMAAVVAVVWPAIIAAANSSTLILSDNSLLDRYQLWAQTTNMLLSGDISTMLFGNGLVQNGNFVASGLFNQTDNAFLATWTQIGLVGVIVWIMLMWALWRYIFSYARAHESTLAIAVAASFSTWIARGVFNTGTDVYVAFFVLLLLGLSEERKIHIRQGQLLFNRPIKAIDAAKHRYAVSRKV